MGRHPYSFGEVSSEDSMTNYSGSRLEHLKIETSVIGDRVI
jgi:hypothetical protein